LEQSRAGRAKRPTLGSDQRGGVWEAGEAGVEARPGGGLAALQAVGPAGLGLAFLLVEHQAVHGVLGAAVQPFEGQAGEGMVRPDSPTPVGLRSVAEYTAGRPATLTCSPAMRARYAARLPDEGLKDMEKGSVAMFFLRSGLPINSRARCQAR
jgi:hypothetical protein